VQKPIGGGETRLRIETELSKDHGKADFANLVKIVDQIKKDYPQILKDPQAPTDKILLVREAIGGSVSNELRFNAILSVILALVGIGIYVSLRFETGFGIAAMVATLHDVLMTVALFVFFGGQFNAALIAAILLIIGYSVNDTIVVFDRIREGMQTGRKGSVIDIMNSSINETLSRTIITGGVTLLSTISLFFFGGPVLADFALAILIGVLVGTYSSVFVAAPVVLWWNGNRVEAKALSSGQASA
jgi:preprotein translocase SecF subunit